MGDNSNNLQTSRSEGMPGFSFRSWKWDVLGTTKNRLSVVATILTNSTAVVRKVLRQYAEISTVSVSECEGNQLTTILKVYDHVERLASIGFCEYRTLKFEPLASFAKSPEIPA